MKRGVKKRLRVKVSCATMLKEETDSMFSHHFDMNRKVSKRSLAKLNYSFMTASNT